MKISFDVSIFLCIVFIQRPVSIKTAGTTALTFDSIQKLSLVAAGSILLCYCTVSPHTLPIREYNTFFRKNIKTASLTFLPPLFFFLLVFNGSFNNINDVVGTFYTSFTVGFFVAFALEMVLTTILRLGVFALWEPSIFDLTPDVPAAVLPWVLRENGYRPKRITLFAADFITSCVAAPAVEEWVKLKVVQLCVKLPR